MEFLIACGTSIAAKITEYTVAPVGSHVGYILHYRRNVRALETETKEVNDKKKRLEDLADEAKRRGEKIHDDIDECLTKAHKIAQAAQNLTENTNIECSLKGCFCYLVARCRQSKRAEKLKKSLVEIKNEIRFENISYRPKLKNFFENKDYLNSATREKFVDGIRNVLEDSNIRTIGIHGMPGAGKTTLAKEIARRATSNDWNLFGDAVIVTVSQTPNFETIQQQIADRLGLKFDRLTKSERALELQNRLKDENRFLIILDDIWNDELKLEDVGIVFDSGQKGCKILMTSRFEKVLGNDMGVDENRKVDFLSEDEARNWFESIVGDKIVTTPAFQEYGNKIVEKCGRLPLCIVTAAHSLKNCDELLQWRNAWRQLQRSKHDEVVHAAIKLCYEKLRSDEAKQLLFLCSLHEEDANIKMENLVRYCWGQIKMFNDASTIQEARDSVYCSVKELKDCCLLLEGDRSGTVKMHDVVRDVAISIAKESHGMHCFGDGSEVKKFLKGKKFEDLKAISLPNGYLDELVFERSEYTGLELMICTWKESSLKIIPRDFLERTKVLRVLVFLRSYYQCPKVFASHLSPLENLCTLCLRDSDVEDIAEIGKLKNLEILDLSESKIKKLPGEIGQLTRLRMLDLNGCKGLQVIEPNVILHLKCLEELYVDQFKNWHRIDQVDNNMERRIAGLDELKHLVRLTTLQLFVADVKMLPEDLLSQRLERYKIAINIEKGVFQWRRQKESGDGKIHFPIEHVSTQLQIRHTEGSLLREHGLEMLMKKSEELHLDGLNGVNNIVSELDKEGFPELRSLELRSNNTIQHLVNSMGQIVFRRLEALFLEDLSNLQQICHGKVTVESFKMLRAVTVRKCNSLKKLLPFFNARQIEEIRISDCNAIEEIFTHEVQDDVHDDDDDNNKEEPLQLRILVLENLSKLREFCSKILLKKIGSSQKQKEPFVGDSIMPPLFNGKFLCFPKLEKLELRGCHVKKIWDDKFRPSSTSFCCLKKLVVANCKFLKCVVPSSTASFFEQLSDLEVRGCEAMEIIVSRDEGMNRMSFPKLCVLRLYNLPRLSKFSSVIFSEFPILDELYIRNCPELKTFISVSSEEKSNTTMPSLFNENFLCFPKLENLELRGCHVKKIWDDQFLPSLTSFSCLKKLVVANCKFLKCIFSSSTVAGFKQLSHLEVTGCEAMDILVGTDERMDKMSFPKLSCLTLEDLPRLSKFPSGIFSEFPMLGDLDIRNCPELKTFISVSSEEKLNTTMPSLFNENDTNLKDDQSIAWRGDTDAIKNKREGVYHILPPVKDVLGFFNASEKAEKQSFQCRQDANLKDHHSLAWRFDTLQLYIEGPEAQIFSSWRIQLYQAIIFSNWGEHCSFICLVEVDLGYCKSCYCLPPLGQLPFLKKLHIQGFDRVERVGEEFFSTTDSLSSSKPFKSLESLTFSHMSRWKEWSFMESGVFSDLKQLTLDNCRKLEGTCFPTYLPSLQSLLISGCKKQVVASLSTDGLPLLSFLKIGHCKELVSFPIRTLPANVETLKIMGCKELVSLSEDGWPSKLKSLEISDCEKLFGNSLWWNLRRVTSLRSLQIIDIDEVMDSFPEEWQLPTTLKSLTLRHFRNLKSLNGKALQHHTSLQELKIELCHHLRYLPEEGLPESLSHLEIFGCGFLKRRCQKVTGEDWPKISHIPHIWIDCKNI